VQVDPEGTKEVWNTAAVAGRNALVHVINNMDASLRDAARKNNINAHAGRMFKSSEYKYSIGSSKNNKMVAKWSTAATWKIS
jgi:hypothetical protein